MSRVKNKWAVLLPVFLCLAVFLCPIGKGITVAGAEARAECVVEVSSRRILHEKNAEIRLPMASTTKVLTACILIEDCPLDEVVTIPQAAEGVEGSSVYLKAGEQYTVLDLLYGLMLRSGNDCAVALALYHSGSIEAFAAEMNARAVLMGATSSRFQNPHGLHDALHYTTARDLAFIAAHALQNETFREIVSCKYYEPRGWKNKNKMLTEYEEATGVKTGFTTAAGRCLVTSAKKNGMELVSVVLNCPEMYERSKELLNTAYSEYQMIPFCDTAQGYDGFRIEYGFAYPLKKLELRGIQIATELYDPIPEVSGEVAGQMKIYLQNNLIFSQNLYIM